MKRSRSLAALALALSSIFAPRIAAADPLIATAGGHGQQALGVRVEAGGVRVKVCASGKCDPDSGAVIALGDEVKASIAGATVKSSVLTSGREIVRVDVPIEKGDAGATWTLLLAAPLAGKGNKPVVVWTGLVGVSRGEHGEGRVNVIVDEPLAKGARRILVGERREDVTLCGRPTLVSAKEIDPATFELIRAASVQNLGADERAKAVKITATRVAEGEAATSGVRLLHASAASSAVDRIFGSLTDGDPETIWSENKAGSGEGEFVTMASSDEVGIVAFTITVRPKADVEGGAAPRTLYLASEAKLVEVKMPEDAWKQPPGTRYTVKLPEELRASCVAVALGDTFGAANKGDPASKLPRVTLAEIEATTTFGAATPEALVGALAGGGERSRAAAALLARGGSAATQATIAGYEKLDPAGKQLAAAIVDGAPCKEQAPFFAAAFARLVASKEKPRGAPGEADPELAHARDQLRRCGRASGDALAQLVAEGKPGVSRLAAFELALVAPAEAVPILVSALDKADEAGRRELRAALAHALKSSRAERAFAAELEAPKLAGRAPSTVIDLLRAGGSTLPKIEGAKPAFAALATPSAPMATRFLLLGPAAELASAGDAAAEGFLRNTLRRDPDPHLRARAAEAAGQVKSLWPDVAIAVDDPDVRVREAAINAFGDTGGAPLPAGLSAALTRRLVSDEWTILRAAAARTMGTLPASPALDAALASKITDLYPEVRGRVIDALGAHKATVHAPLLRARALVVEETLDLRARSVLALAEMCDKGSVDLFTKLAENAVNPKDERDRRLGAAAVAALSVVHPDDLQKRLAPLLAKDAPPGLNEMAKTALASERGCP
ncbi:MAG: HEAT repeat domain-containing protein [Byssovorax sp.]